MLKKLWRGFIGTLGCLVRPLLRRGGYLKCDYGFSCGRHWISIDGYTIAQTSGDDCWLRDEDIHRIGWRCLDHGKHWSEPMEPQAERIREALRPNDKAHFSEVSDIERRIK